MERPLDPKTDPPPTGDPPLPEPRFAIGTVETPRERLAAIAIEAGLADRDGLREAEVAQIVHDLRDPLATIALETYLLDRKVAGGDHANIRSVVARITRNVEFLDRMVQDLLDSCSIGEGRFEIHCRPTDLRELLERVIQRISTPDRERVVLETSRRITLSIDELRIERVLANLIGNALKYAPRCNEIVVRLETGSHVAQVSVIDTGPGLTPAEVGRVFDKYRRGTTAHVADGRGLGLYVSKQIIEAHGGRIGVDSVPGAGARFYFELPAVPA